MNTAASEMLTASHERMTPSEVAEHALLLAGELDGLAEAIIAQNLMMTSLAELIRAQKASARAIDTLAREGKKRAAREALSALAAVPDVAPVPVAVFSPEWSKAMFRPAEPKQEARH